MRNIMATAAAAALVALSIQTARADQPPPPSISVTGTGTVHYSPDIARISLGVRGESSTAAAAAKSVNTRAQAVIDALHKLGLSDANIATSGDSIAGIQSISTGGGGPQPMFRAMAMAGSAEPPIMGGTGSIDVTVNVIYRIK